MNESLPKFNFWRFSCKNLGEWPPSDLIFESSEGVRNITKSVQIPVMTNFYKISKMLLELRSINNRLIFTVKLCPNLLSKVCMYHSGEVREGRRNKKFPGSHPSRWKSFFVNFRISFFFFACFYLGSVVADFFGKAGPRPRPRTKRAL